MRDKYLKELRDDFATIAFDRLLSYYIGAFASKKASQTGPIDREAVASEAYKLADAAIKARGTAR